MTYDEICDLVVSRIEGRNGMKATELCAEEDIVMACSHDTPLIVVLNHLVHTGRIAEIEYTVPNLEYRLKSFYLPAGSVVTQITNAEIQDGTE